MIPVKWAAVTVEAGEAVAGVLFDAVSIAVCMAAIGLVTVLQIAASVLPITRAVALGMGRGDGHREYDEQPRNHGGF